MKLNLGFDASISRGQRIWAGVLVLLAVVAFLTQRPPASLFSGCGCLLYAWSLMCYPAPGFRSTVSDMYQSARRGTWFTPKYARLVMLLAVILMLVGIFVPFGH
ncbi:hypothetical protein ABQJ54_16155 [Rhodanobacter sp. Si-c]|uniref:Uncharacterized protein n=1 Tax=Rhodanobacter lycopersici TaxID=3162487 RepID=A0ABV3QHG5_9GAMM